MLLHHSLLQIDYTSINNIRFPFLLEAKSYIPIAGCVLEHILTTTDLTNHEKLYYLLADGLAHINGKNITQGRVVSLASEDWATRLGCSRSLVFSMQKSLVKKGYFIIDKDWNEIGLNKRNLITPTLPTEVFNYLNNKYPYRGGEGRHYNPATECKRAYLDRTKLFIKLNYQLLLTITANLDLNPQQKILWLGFYTRCYKNYMLQGREDYNVERLSYNDDSSFSFISSYQELADSYSCNTKHLSKSMKTLEEQGFINTKHIYIRKKKYKNINGSNNPTLSNDSYDDSSPKAYSNDYSHELLQDRQDQSLWRITLSLPRDCILELEKTKNRSNSTLSNVNVLSAYDTGNTNNTIDKVNSNLAEDFLMIGGVKFNLNLEQGSLLKSLVIGDTTNSTSTNAGINKASPNLSSSVVDTKHVVRTSNGDTGHGCEDHRCGTEGYLTDDDGDFSSSSPLALDLSSLGSDLALSSIASSSYVDCVMDELHDGLDNNLEEDILDEEVRRTNTDHQEGVDYAYNDTDCDQEGREESNGTGIKSDPIFSNSGLLLNKDLISKLNNIKSNLGATPKVLFNNFLKRFSKKEFDHYHQTNGNTCIKKKEGNKEFNIISELIRTKIKELPKDKADKARKFAYSLISKGLASGYAASLSKHDLAKQIIHHAATWKPTKLGVVSREKEIDTALSVAWKKIVGGTWQVPLELAKAEVLQYEFRTYRKKYQESGVLSQEAKALEADVNGLLGGWYDLTGRITSSGKLAESGNNLDKNKKESIRGIGDNGNRNSTDKLDSYGLDDSVDRGIIHNLFDCNRPEDYSVISEDNSSYGQMVNLSDIQEQQKYLKVIPSRENNDDSLTLQTINGKEYFVKLKELEMNDYGEFVMTLKPVSKNNFLELNQIQEAQFLLD